MVPESELSTHVFRATCAIARLVLVSLAVAGFAGAADYFVAAPPLGSDGNAGTDAEPFATVDRVNALALVPGDRVFFRSGNAFPGSLVFAAGTGGTEANPIVLGSYGGGRAVINGGDATALFLYNTAGFEIRDLNFAGSGRTTNFKDGVSIYSDLPGSARLPHVRFDRVEVTGFGGVGVAIGSFAGNSGFRNVRFTDVHVHDCRDGFLAYAEEAIPNLPPNYGVENLTLRRCLFENNPGKAGFNRPTGSGAVLGGVDGGLVEHCIARGNGAEHTFIFGPVGIWAYNSRAVTIQHCESYANRTLGGDGGGFDLDGGVTDSVIQYCYSHDNDGAGYLLAAFANSGPTGNNTLRYNVSVNDGRRGRQGALFFWGASAEDRLDGAWVHNNLVYYDAAGVTGPTRAAMQFYEDDLRGLHVVNNVIVTRGSDALVVEADAASLPTSSVWLRGNSYWSEEGGLGFHFNAATYSSLTSFRATGQERSGAVDTGFELDPRLVGPLNPAPILGTFARLEAAADHLGAFQLRIDSPLIDSGLDLALLGGPVPGPRDFFGLTPLPGGPALDIGPHEPRPPLEAWRARYFTPEELADPTQENTRWGHQADPDGDRRTNLYEYAVDSSPIAAANVRNPLGGKSPDGRLTLTFLRARADVIYTVQAGGSLTDWISVAVNPGVPGEMATVTDEPPVGSNARFLRLRVEPRP